MFRFGFVIVNASVDVPPARIGFVVNSFEITGGKTAVKVAVATLVVVVPLSVLDKKPLTLLCGPDVLA